MSADIPRATFFDYFSCQGGKPIIQIGKDGLVRITHAYLKNPSTVITHILPEERGTVILNTADGPKEFAVASLWDFEGKPCQDQSLETGGEGYPRENRG